MEILTLFFQDTASAPCSLLALAIPGTHYPHAFSFFLHSEKNRDKHPGNHRMNQSTVVCAKQIPVFPLVPHPSTKRVREERRNTAKGQEHGKHGKIRRSQTSALPLTKRQPAQKLAAAEEVCTRLLQERARSRSHRAVGESVGRQESTPQKRKSSEDKHLGRRGESAEMPSRGV